MTQSIGQQKARGAFFTPPEVSRFVADWAIRSARDRILEPSCGDAAFLLPAAGRLVSLGLSRRELAGQIDGVDIHGPSLAEARARLAAEGYEVSLTEGDFFDRAAAPVYDAVVGNPPFVRYQDFSGEARAKSLRAALAQGCATDGIGELLGGFHRPCRGILEG